MRRAAFAVWLGFIACSGAKTNLKTGACTDADGDKYGVGADCLGPDCNDQDATKFISRSLFTDADNDGAGVGDGTTTCVGTQAPHGFAFTNTDCDDTRASCTTACSDADGDGTPACAGDCDDDNAHCDSTCADGDTDGYCTNYDCADGDANHWADCDTCTDGDLDDHGTGCDLGGDCNDADPDMWVTCLTCRDDDHDGRFANCDAFVNRPGPDCDDTSISCNVACQDKDADGMRSCDGDCNDNGTICLIDASGGENGGNAGTTGVGGTFEVVTEDAQFLAEKQALPDDAFHIGRVPVVSATTLIVPAGDTVTLTALDSTYDGVRVEAEATLILSGAGPFAFNTSGHVLIAGKIRTNTAGVVVSFVPEASDLDLTLSGEIDVSGAAGAQGIDGNELNLGTSLSPFLGVSITGRILANGGPGSSGRGGAGGLIRVYADAEIFTASNLLARGGSGVSAVGDASGDGGQISLNTTNGNGHVVRVRGDAVVLSGGGGLMEGGAGGEVNVQARAQLSASAGFVINANGGNTSSAAGEGGAGGSMTLFCLDLGSGSVSASIPTLNANGGNAAQGTGGPGGGIVVSVGDSNAIAPAAGGADTLTLRGNVTAKGGSSLTGGAGGSIRIHNGDHDSQIQLEAVLDVSGGAGGGGGAGGAGGNLLVGRAHNATNPPTTEIGTTSVTVKGAMRADAGAGMVPAGGKISFNVAALTYESGAITALGTGGQCLAKSGVIITGTPNVNDGDDDADFGSPGAIAGDLDQY